MNYSSLGIVGHESRKTWISILDEAVDVAPEVISIDDGMLGCGPNHLKVLTELRDSNRTHPSNWVTVIEDDAQPVQNFRAQLDAALAWAPSNIVSLYTGTGYPQQRQRQFRDAAVHYDTCWFQHKMLRHAVGYAIHRSILHAVIDHITPLMYQDRLPWAPDDAISTYAARHGIQVSYSNPSLVDHQDGPQVQKQRSHLGQPVFERKRIRKAINPGTRQKWDSSHVIIA